MKKLPFLLFAPAVDPASPARGTGTSTPPSNPEGEADEKDPADSGEEQEEEEEEQADPAPPAAILKPLTALDRGKLIAIGMSGVIKRLQAAEGALEVSQAALAGLRAENKLLKAANGQAPAQIEAAKKGRANEVSRAVRAELGKLGITQAAAPELINAKDSEKIMSRAEFVALSTKERGEFMGKGGRITD